MKHGDELQSEYGNEMRALSENELNVTIYLTRTYCMTYFMDDGGGGAPNVWE